MITPIDVIDNAIRLIQKGWCQNSFATDSEGREVEWQDETATCFCLSGALHRSFADIRGRQIHPSGYSPEEVAIRYILEGVARDRGHCVIGFNDLQVTTQADVVAVLQETKRRLTSQLHT